MECSKSYFLNINRKISEDGVLDWKNIQIYARDKSRKKKIHRMLNKFVGSVRIIRTMRSTSVETPLKCPVSWQ